MFGGTVSRERLWRTAALALLGVLAWQAGSGVLAPRVTNVESRVVAPPVVAPDAHEIAVLNALPTTIEIEATAITPPPPAPPVEQPALRVGNTGGMGAYLRATPRMADRLRAWPDGTPMLPTGDETTAEGRHWRQVRAPDGGVGWLPSDYLAP